MTTFYVGQLVRIKWAATYAKHLIGVETRINGQLSSRSTDWWLLDITNVSDSTGFWRCPKDDASKCLEPIVFEGHQPAELSVEELLPFLKEKRVQA